MPPTGVFGRSSEAAKKKIAKPEPQKAPEKAVFKKETPERIKKNTTVAQKAPLPEIDRIEKIITSRKEGITTTALSAETGLNTTRVRYLVSRLKSQGRIVTIERGLYAGTIPARKKPGTSDLAYIQEIIWKSGKEVTITELIKKTRLEEDKVRISNIRLISQGKIKAVSRNEFKKA